MQEKVEIITNHIVQFWTILDKNTQKRILCQRGHFLINYTPYFAHVVFGRPLCYSKLKFDWLNFTNQGHKF